MPIIPLLFSAYLSAFQTFALSGVATALTFILIGVVKARVTHKPTPRPVVETLFIGGCAALLAFVAGVVLKGFVGI